MTTPVAPGVPGAVVGATVQPPPPVTPAQIETANTLAVAKVAETERKTQGQRDINRIWERTQQVVALLVVFVSIGVAAFKSAFDTVADPNATAGPAFIFLVGAANLVIGFYFGRTNHQKTGGVGTDDAGR